MTNSWDDYLNNPEIQQEVFATYKKLTASDPPPKRPIIRAATLMRQLEADLRASFPDVEFTLSVPECATTKPPLYRNLLVRRSDRRCGQSRHWEIQRS